MLISLMVVFIVLVLIEMLMNMRRSNAQLKKMESLIESVVKTSEKPTEVPTSTAGSDSNETALDLQPLIEQLTAGLNALKDANQSHLTKLTSTLTESFKSSAIKSAVDALIQLPATIKTQMESVSIQAPPAGKTPDVHVNLEPLKKELASWPEHFQKALDKFTESAAKHMERSTDGQQKLLQSVENTLIPLASIPAELKALSQALNANASTVQKVSPEHVRSPESDENAKALVEQLSELTEKFTEFHNDWAEKAGHFVGDMAKEGEMVVSDIRSQNEMVVEELRQSAQTVSTGVQTALSDTLSDWAQKTESVGAQLEKNALAFESMGSKITETVGQSLVDSNSAFIESIKQNHSDTTQHIQNFIHALEEKLGGHTQSAQGLSDRLEQSGHMLEEVASLSRINQVALQADIEMLDKALTSILEKLNETIEKPEDEHTFVQRLNATLESFHEKASEVLIDNAVKMREILLSSPQSDVEPENSES